jgi:hypothetical protein
MKQSTNIATYVYTYISHYLGLLYPVYYYVTFVA